MADLIGAFHFLRPVLLLALLPLAVIWWKVRPRKSAHDTSAEGIAPHLAHALTVGFEYARRIYPIDGVALTLAFLALAAAGPTWTRVTNPLLAQTAPLIVAMKVTPSMQSTDIQPSRHKRASFKILDLIERRAGAQTALFAYAGSAHRVTPLTEDPNIVRSYLSGLSPAIMPKDGDRADDALSLAIVELGRSVTPGAILFVLDDLNPSNLPAFNKNAAERPPIIFLVVSAPAATLPQLEQIDNSVTVRIQPDDTDLDQIERRVLSAYRQAQLDDAQQDWEDKGWLLAWPALLLFLPWFRRGWTVQWALAFLLVGSLGTPARADGWKDWFLTPDQQGQLAFDDKDFSRAADLFQDPLWRAYAMLRSGRYAEAAEAYDFIETSEAANARGIALLRNRNYHDGVRAFEKALARDPVNTVAKTNLEIARAIVSYVERVQLASDTGEETGIGADDTVYDNESSKGAVTFVEREPTEGPPAGLTTDDWMRAVDTQVGDFLASRFQLENSRGGE